MGIKINIFEQRKKKFDEFKDLAKNFAEKGLLLLQVII